MYLVFWKNPPYGWSSTCSFANHFTEAIPYQPGTISRAGNPCSSGKG